MKIKLNNLWINFSYLVTLLVAAASTLGIYDETIYAKETLSWASQGLGQDIINILVAVPALIVSTYYLSKGSFKALLVWMGSYFYIFYSYLLYAFFVNMNYLLPVYIAILGLSFYTVIGVFNAVDIEKLGSSIKQRINGDNIASFLSVFAILFAFLWLSDLIPAVVSGKIPESVIEVGLPVNPIHVLDLAFVIPGMLITAYFIYKNEPLGFFFAAPLLVFMIIMGLAIISMVFIMRQRGIVEPSPVVFIMSFTIGTSLYLLNKFLV